MHSTLAIVLTEYSADMCEGLNNIRGLPFCDEPWTDSAQQYVVGFLSNILAGESR
jgi:hypothetical protein